MPNLLEMMQAGFDKSYGRDPEAVRRMTEPLVGASLSPDPVEFMRSFAGAAGMGSIEESIGAGLTGRDPRAREAAAALGEALQSVTPQGQQAEFDRQVQAKYEQDVANETAALQLQEAGDKAQRQAYLGSFKNIGDRATAITQVDSTRLGYNSANSILEQMRDSGQGNWTIPTEMRGRLKLKRLPILLSLKEMIGTGVLQPAELQWLQGIVGDPTAWNRLEVLSAEQRGEFLGFMELAEQMQQRNRAIYKGLATEEPGLFDFDARFDRGMTEPPAGFVPMP